MQETLSPLAASVRAELRAAERTQEQIGAVLGVGQAAVSQRMRGKRQWRAEELLKLSEAFGIPLDRLYRSERTPETASSTVPAAELEAL